MCVRILILTTGLWQTQFLRYFPLPFELAIPPLFWLYVASLVDPGFSLKRSVWIHFIPFGISLAYSILIYCLVLREHSNAEKDALANSLLFNQVKHVEDYLCIISAVIYWSAGLRLVIRYRRWLSANISDTDFPTYSWLKNIALLMGLVIILLSTDILLDSIFDVGFYRFTHWKFFFIYCAALIYYLGFRGYHLRERKPVALPVRPDDPAQPGASLDPVPALVNKIPIDTSAIPGKSPRLTDEKASEVKKAILEAMEVHVLYLDPELSLEKLAKFTRSTPAAVSWVINQQFKKTFRSMVNEYRVECVRNRLVDHKYDQFAVLGIAYDCGFNSEASFYRIFRSVTGLSPTEYLKSIGRTR